MSAFGIAPPRPKKSKWSQGDERTVMSNVANIISPNLSPEILHAFLLRFQFEEVQYKLDHVNEEIPNILYGESTIISQNLDQRSVVPPEVRARDALVSERRQIIEEIEKIYPAFVPPLPIRFSVNKPVRKCIVPNSHCISAIMGTRCSILFGLEQSYKVRISLRPKQSDAKGEEESYVLIIGNNIEDVDRCYDQIQKIIEVETSKSEEVGEEKQKVNVSKDPNSLTLSFDPDEEIPPWKDENLNKIKLNYSAEVDGEVNDIINGIDTSEKEEEENILTFDELRRFGVDITRRDISSLLCEPIPPGQE